MSLNPMQRIMIARGMGGLGGWDVGDDGVPVWVDGSSPGGSIYGGSSGGSSGDFNWNNFANTVGGTLSSIFGHGNTSNNAALLAAQQQAALLAAQQAAARAATSNPGANNADDDSDSGLGIAFTDKGLRLGEKTTISYGMLLAGGAVIMLVQSSGFQRRR
jgi:hypothetical protein